MLHHIISHLKTDILPNCRGVCRFQIFLPFYRLLASEKTQTPIAFFNRVRSLM